MRLEAHRLVFVDETGTNTKMVRTRGRCAKSQRLKGQAQFGHWKTQTFIAGLRRGALTAPFVVDQPMNRSIFDIWVRTQLAPTLSKGDVVSKKVRRDFRLATSIFFRYFPDFLARDRF
jgi:hypothetical protein